MSFHEKSSSNVKSKSLSFLSYLLIPALVSSTTYAGVPNLPLSSFTSAPASRAKTKTEAKGGSKSVELKIAQEIPDGQNNPLLTKFRRPFILLKEVPADFLVSKSHLKSKKTNRTISGEADKALGQAAGEATGGNVAESGGKPQASAESSTESNTDSNTGSNTGSNQVEFLTQNFSKLNSLKGHSISEVASELIFIANFGHGLSGYEKASDFQAPPGGKGLPDQMTQTNYWTAVFPKATQVKGMALQIETFDEGNGKHMQIRFFMDQDILLIPQRSEFKASKGEVNADFDPALLASFVDLSRTLDLRTKSLESDALGVPKDRPLLIRGEMVNALMGLRFSGGPADFSFVNGITGNLMVGFIMASPSHMALDQLSRGSYVREYPLNLNQTQRNEALKFVLERPRSRVSDDGLSYKQPEIYNTVFINCITGALEVLKVAYAAGKESERMNIDADQFNPFSVPDYLLGLKIIKENQVKVLNNIYSISLKKDENVIGVIKSLPAVIKSDAFDTFARHFALAVAEGHWSAKDINKFINILAKQKSTVLLKGAVAAVQLESEGGFVVHDGTAAGSDNARINEIANKVDLLLTEAEINGGKEAMNELKKWLSSFLKKLIVS